MIDGLILAVLQGVAEFLPISSSGHLVLGKALLGVDEQGLRLDIMLHVGTLVSIGVFYFAIIRRIVCERDWRYMLKVVLSAVPAGVVGMFFRHELETLFASPRAVGGALLFTGMVLIATRYMPKFDKSVSWWGALMMGVAQAVAIIPGVSRSGMTIAVARLLGVEASKCAEFSFLMSIPPIAGAALLEMKDSLGVATPAVEGEVTWTVAIVGAMVAAVVGYVSLKFLLRSLRSQYFWLFGPYCLIAGTLVLVFS